MNYGIVSMGNTKRKKPPPKRPKNPVPSGRRSLKNHPNPTSQKMRTSGRVKSENEKKI